MNRAGGKQPAEAGIRPLWGRALVQASMDVVWVWFRLHPSGWGDVLPCLAIATISLQGRPPWHIAIRGRISSAKVQLNPYSTSR